MQRFGDNPSSDDFEVEVSALDDLEDETDPALAAQPLPASFPSSNPRSRRLVIGCCLVLAALLVLVSVPALRGQALSLFNGPASSTPTSVGVSSIQIFPAQPQPVPGWALAGPRFATTIVFAPSAPAIGYTCGLQTVSVNGQPVPLTIGVTVDAGIHWRLLRGPASAVACNISVNPTNAADVALLASPCEPCSTPLETTKLYRSFDAGLHWSLWSLPASGPDQSQDLLYAQWAWVGSTLVIAPHQSGGVGYQRLAASVDAQPFTWLDTTGLFAGAPANANINEMLATRSTLYVQLDFADCTTVCTMFMQSHVGLNGAHWSPFNPTYQGQSVYLMATGGDEHTLLGQVVRDAPPDNRIYLRSTDGGQTWQNLAARPDLLVADPLYAAPDGSVFAVFLQDPNGPTGAQGTQAALGIYALAPGASAWRYLGQSPPAGSFVLAWNAAGHPVALWGLVDPNDPTAGLERRQL
jgi:hypothetical protein